MVEETQLGGEPLEEQKSTVVEEIKVQAHDLIKTFQDLVHEATVRRITVMRKDRTLVDVPMPLGVAAGVVLGIYLPILSAIVGVGALLTGCTVRIERDEPPAVS